MSDLNSLFKQAADEVQNLSQSPDNTTLLKLYALYKQGSSGDVSGKRPGFTKPVKRAKFDAWSEMKGKSNEDAQQSYIDLVNSLTA